MTRPPLRFGFSTLGCPTAEFDDAVALARAHQLPAIELRALSGSVDLPEQLRARFGAPARLADWRMTQPPTPTFPVVDASLRLSDGTEADFDALCDLAPWADALGATWIRVFDGPEVDRQTGLREAIRRLARWSELRDRNGWRATLAVETHDSLLNSEAIHRWVASVPNTPVVWDAHHTWKRGHEDPCTTWARCAPHIVHLHIKDSQISGTIHGSSAGYVMPDDGDFPASTLLEALRQSGFAGAVILEWEKLWHPTLPPLEAALDRARSTWFGPE
jgi:sugar phosphate isomerase/epimerase